MRVRVLYVRAEGKKIVERWLSLWRVTLTFNPEHLTQRLNFQLSTKDASVKYTNAASLFFCFRYRRYLQVRALAPSKAVTLRLLVTKRSSRLFFLFFLSSNVTMTGHVLWTNPHFCPFYFCACACGCCCCSAYIFFSLREGDSQFFSCHS